MLRQTFLYLSRQGWLRRWAEDSSISRKLTSRFVAGRTLDESITVLAMLRKENILATLDFLGENVTSLEEAHASKRAYVDALNAIEAARLPATVSLKLTQFGLDFTNEACYNNVVPLLECARHMGTRIEVDMESSEYTDRTLDVVTLMQDNFRGHVRAVIQAYLYRSEADIRMLSDREIPVRLCKGAYKEPPSVAYPKKADVDRNYVALMKLLLQRGTYPAIASHDEKIIEQALSYVKEQNISSDRFEFQMLYGIRRDLQRRIVNQSYRLRLYVPYGDAWYPYFMRRLAERPANALFVARNLLRS